MNFAYLSPIADHLWQSTLFAAVAGLLTLLLRKNHARVRHGLWLAASGKFLIPLSALIGLGSHIRWRTAPSHLSVVMDQVSQPFTTGAVSFSPASAVLPTANPLPAILVGIWVCGLLGITGAWLVRWRRIRAAVRAGRPVELAAPMRAISSPTLLEPGIFGVFRPVLMLPEGIFDRLTPAQLSAVVAHELCHIRYRDNLAAALHMSVETVFWFHPLVWWIGKRMVEERERACDEGVLTVGSEPRVYAEAILNVCKLYVESPLACVAGVTGANLKKRIEAIMTKRTSQRLNGVQKFLLAGAGIAALAGPLVIGIGHVPVMRAQSPATWEAPAAVAPPVSQIETPAQAAREAPLSPPPAAAQVVAQATVVAPDDEHSRRVAYAAEKFGHNDPRGATYIKYGPPDQIDFRASDTQHPAQIWRYNYLANFHSNVEFEFAATATTDRFAVHINWPPATAYEGQPGADAGFTPVIDALNRELHLSTGEQAATITVAGLPGRQASMQVYPKEELQMLMVPLDSLSGRIDVLGVIKALPQTGAGEAPAASVRDYLNLAQPAPHPMYNAGFMLQAGSYVCRLLVREQATGRTYTEVINFEVK